MHHKLIILGSGPAGCTAAIYAARANLYPAIIAGLEQGGQLTKTNLIENWPGEDKGTSGTALMEKMLNQAKHFGTNIIFDHITQVNLAKQPFQLKTDRNEYTCDALIIATGVSAKFLNIPSEQKYLGYGVSTCATCDGYFYKNKKVAIIGGGNTAAEDARYLAKLASEVTIIHRHDQLKAEQHLIDKLKTTVNINFEFDHVVDEILGNGRFVTGIKIKNIVTNTVKTIDIDGVFIAIGYQPNTKIFINQLEMEQEYIKIGYNYKTATSVSGVFAAGDVTNQNYHQAVISAGLGCTAALDTKKFFDSK